MSREPFGSSGSLGRRPITALALAAALIIVAVSVGCSGDDVDPAQAEAAREKERVTRAWADAAIPVIQDSLSYLLSDHLALRVKFDEDWGTPRLRTLMTPTQDLCGRFRAALKDVQSLPGGTSEIERANAGFERAFGHFVSGCERYITAIRREDDGLLLAGDEEFVLGQREVGTMSPGADEIAGPRTALKQELDALMAELRPVRITENAGLRSRNEMIDALRASNLKRAQEEAAQGRHLFEQITVRLREAAEPSDQRLLEALGDLRSGYGLITAGFADYERGIKSRPRFLLVGDRKFKRGYKVATDGAQTLIEVLRPVLRQALDGILKDRSALEPQTHD